MKAEPILVLHVGPTGAKGGVAVVAQSLASINLDGYTQACVPTSAFLEGKAFGKFIEFGRAIVRLRKLLSTADRGGKALLHLHVSSSSSLYRKSMIGMWARARGIPYVAHLHSGRLLEPAGIRSGSIPFILLDKLIRGAAVTIVSLEYWLSQARRRFPHIALERLVAIPNPVASPSSFTAPRDGPQPLTVGYYGSLLKSKGVQRLVECFGLAAERQPALSLKLAGVGRRRDIAELTQLIRKLGIQDRVSINGWLQGVARHRFLAGLGGFVLLSESEWFGMSAMEAIACGRRALVSDLPSLRESLGHIGVRYVPAATAPDEMAQELLNMTESQPLSRSEMAEVRTRMVAYHPNVIGRQFGELYTRVLVNSALDYQSASQR